ncbi:MAG: MoaD/ThiS family protein [Methanomicrobiales archaeon]|jgi:molybdopterin synthase sulfur carrier subunit|nr:MoaD/ThiS family protein [Methanomicrobiales archaeon]
MKIRLRLFARYRDIYGDMKELEVTDPCSPLGILRLAFPRGTEGHTLSFDETGGLKRHLILLINQRRLTGAEYETLILSEGDELALLPPVAGG